FVTGGAPHFLSSTTLRPRGPSVTFTALARISTPFMISARACSLNSSILAAIGPPNGSQAVRACPCAARVRDRAGLLAGLAEHAEDLVLAQDHVLRAVDLHVRAAVLADQDAVALLDLRGDAPAFLGQLAGAHGHDLALLRLLLGGVGDDDAAPDGLLLLDAANEQPVGERLEVHGALLEMDPRGARKRARHGVRSWWTDSGGDGAPAWRSVAEAGMHPQRP